MAQLAGSDPMEGHEGGADLTDPPCANQPQVLVTDVPRRWAWVFLAVMAAVFASLSLLAVRQKSVTVDEFGHLPVGYNVLTTGDFRYCELNPPLMNVLSALPLLFMEVSSPEATDFTPDEKYAFWANGYEFMEKNTANYHRLYVAARCVTVVVVAMLGVLLFGWAGLLAPTRPNAAGLLAAGLVWFSPGIMAHSQLVTTDAGCAFFTVLALAALHLFLHRPNLARSAGAGLALGLAALTKSSCLYLYAIAPVLVIVGWLCYRKSTLPRLFAGLALAFLVSGVTICAGYHFQEVGRLLNSFAFASGAGKLVQRIVPGGTPLPLPASFVTALDNQLRDAAVGDPSFLFGQYYFGGKWFYFIALLAVKTPLPLLALFFLGMGRALALRAYRGLLPWLLLMPAALLFVVFSFFSNKQLGLRMILPAAPLVWLFVAICLCAAPRRRWWSAIVTVLLVWCGVETARIHPHYLTYFNQIAGGPSQGFRYATDSNLDWGQDLIALRHFQTQRETGPIQLLYFGRVDPAIYGIDYRVPDLAEGQPLGPGLVAISNSLRGRSYPVNDHGRFIFVPALEIAEGKLIRPVANIGNSIQVYRLARPIGGRWRN
ncbi:MAG TPA: phospholipid carrier-dependent glycosyltransferase [Phycisphaerae bacterium]|nr:phospholipid carrier-dependent glycosyltransferase [Phycisphaerae bacterium]